MLLIALTVLLVVVVALGRWNIPVYALSPGDATPVAPLVTIEGLATDHHHDTIMLTDVYLQSLTAWQWLTMHLQSHVEFVNANQLTDPGVPTDELSAQGFLQMSDSKEAAEVAAFNALGWRTPSTATGAVVTSVVAPSPARSAHVNVADRVVAINATRIDSACAVIRAVHALAPGTRLHLRIERAAIDAKGVITWRHTKVIEVTTTTAPAGLGPTGCEGVKGPSRSWLGFSLEDSISYALPAKVAIDTSNIGGPSAGLAMTLTLIDQLSSGSLVGHQIIAATGTMDVLGNVGDVGGVAQKTVSVQRAGAKYFIVPQVEVATAQAAAQPGLKIIGVTSLSQTLSDLRAIGGEPPTPLTKPH